MAKTLAPVFCLGGMVLMPAAAWADGAPPDDQPTSEETPTTETPAPTAPTPAPAPEPQTTTTTTTTTTPAPMSTSGYTATSEETPGMYSYGWYDPRLSTGIGVGVIVGGGVSGFQDKQMRDTVSSNVAGLWDVRVILGTHIPIGVEAGYVGTAQSLEHIGGVNTGTLIGTDLEGVARWNILPHYSFNPYLLAGAGWQHYSVSNSHVPTSASGIETSDNLLIVPLGVGLGYRDRSGFTVDLRGIYRLAPGNPSFVQDPLTGSTAGLSTWSASGSIGYEF